MLNLRKVMTGTAFFIIGLSDSVQATDNPWNKGNAAQDLFGSQPTQQAQQRPQPTQQSQPVPSQQQTIEQATQALSNNNACSAAFSVLLSNKPSGIVNSIDSKHLESKKQPYKGYFSGNSVDAALNTLSTSKCTPQSTKYVSDTNVVECHLACEKNIGYDVDLSNIAKETKNILLVYKAYNRDYSKAFNIELYPRENP